MLIDVGGHRLHLETFGRGTPAVVFDAGLSDAAERWGAEPGLVAAFPRVCSVSPRGAAAAPRQPRALPPDGSAAALVRTTSL